MGLGERFRFLTRYLSEPCTVGAVAPSSQGLSRALCEPYSQCNHQANVLEIGAGTGPITRCLGSILKNRSHDELDVCEVDPTFVAYLRDNVLMSQDFAQARREDRVRLIAAPAQSIEHTNHYDFIVSGLPLTAFELSDVESVLDTVRRALKPGGVFSYFEYSALRKIVRTFSVGRNRVRLRELSPFLDDHIRNHQVAQKRVLFNLPPAKARHFMYKDTADEAPASEESLSV